LVATLREMVGAHRQFKPMYPNFPEQVMEMSDARLYLTSFSEAKQLPGKTGQNMFQSPPMP
jgi:hypothetical protein